MSFQYHSLLLIHEEGIQIEKFNEKSSIYEQMKLLSKERSELTRAYFELKEGLIKLNTSCEIKDKVTNKAERKDNHNLSKEMEYQKYMIDKKQNSSSFLPYSIISLKIASILNVGSSLPCILRKSLSRILLLSKTLL